MPNIIVIVIDRLGAGWLGPYGNTWIESPALNRLATESLLCEFMVSDSHELAAVYRSYLTGIPAWRTSASADPTLPQLARDANYQTLLVTDADEVARHPLAAGFEQVDLLAWTRPAHSAEETKQTRLAEVFAAAGEALLHAKKPAFLWIHAAAMNAAWDAPLALRERVAAEDDPTPQEFVVPPSLELAEDHDPDFLLGIVQAYAAEVMALDENLATLLATVDAACNPANTLLIFTSPRGYALGEHLGVGVAGDALRGELLQVPLLVRYPGGAGRLTRLGGLHQPIDLYSLIAQAIQPDGEFDLESRAHNFVVASSATDVAVRTRHWFYRQSGIGFQPVRGDREPHGQAGSLSHELYAKPDDRWEVNEVSQRATDVVAACEELVQWLHANRDLPGSPELPDLPEILTAARR